MFHSLVLQFLELPLVSAIEDDPDSSWDENASDESRERSAALDDDLSDLDDIEDEEAPEGDDVDGE